MRTTIDARFATAKDTAAALGVSDSRMRKLIRLTRTELGEQVRKQSRTFATQSSGPHNGTDHQLTSVDFKASNSKGPKRSKKRKPTLKSASRKRQARGKVTKANR